MEPKGHWYVRVEKERVLELIQDNGFLELLRLMRGLNSLRFAQNAVATHKSTEDVLREKPGGNESEKPSEKRVRNSAFLYMAAVLYEIVQQAAEIGRYFRNLESFEPFNDLISRIRRDKELLQVLDAARNHFAFHFDRDELRAGIEAIHQPRFVLVHGYRKTQGEGYYELADMAAISYLVELHDYEDLKSRIEEIIGRTTGLLVEFFGAAENLIAEAAVEAGLELEMEN
jgi:hypothetical protein